jgi:lysophospholipase L1-like esterase
VSRLGWVVGAALALMALGCGTNSAGAARKQQPHPIQASVFRGGWVATWGASPQRPSPPEAAAASFDAQTIREVVFASIGGSAVRVRLSNAFGSQPVRIARAAIGVAGPGAGVAATGGVPLTFAGRPSTVIPAGAELTTDPARLAVRPLERLSISLFLPEPSGPATVHAMSRQVSYVAAGDHALDRGGRDFTRQAQSWYLLGSVAVQSPSPSAGAIVAFGDSLTGGVGSRLNANARWPDDLARRLNRVTGGRLGVIDEGIVGNRILTSDECCGPSGLSRLRRDVLGQPGVREVILLEGVNDIGMSHTIGPFSAPHTDVSAAQITAGYQQIIARAHQAGLKVIGGTLLPFKGADYWTAAGEAKREAVNRWIRTSGAFDGVIDFARAVADPAHAQRLAPAYDSGDHLHPNSAGYAAMAAAVNLAQLIRMS